MANRRLALITGASSGIGETFARKLAAQGYDLIITARREQRLRELAQELMDKHGVNIETLTADLSTPDGIAKVEERITAAKDLEILVNNAGFGIQGTFTGVAIEDSQSMLDVHVVATVHLTRAALPGMIERRKGYAINVSSVASFMAYGGHVMYSSTKAFLNAFSTNLSNELLGTGVKIQALCPGFTYTEFHDAEKIKNFDRAAIPAFAWTTSEQVVDASLKALDRNRVVVVPGFINQVFVVLLSSFLGRTRALFASRARSADESV
jgi:short-subunit dehydrogenase